MARNFKFPDPNDYPLKTPAVLCPADRVINIYNQETGEDAKRISKKVREWFFREAHANGWSGGHFLPEVQSQHGAGCILWIAAGKPKIPGTETMLVLDDSLDEDE